MRKSRFTESQIVGIVKELKAGVKAATICRKHGISGATLYNWRAKYEGLEVSDLRSKLAGEITCVCQGSDCKYI
jgi:putative transposase